MVQFTNLPEDLLLEILQHLPDKNDRQQLSQTCKRFNIVFVPYVWKNLIIPDLTVLEYLKNIVSAKDAILFELETQKNSQRIDQLFDLKSKSSTSSARHSAIFCNNYLSASFLQSVEQRLVSPLILQSVNRFEMSVNPKYLSPAPWKQFSGSQGSMSSTFSNNIPNNSDLKPTYSEFSYLCDNILTPNTFPHLNNIVLHYTMTHNYLSAHQAHIEMKKALHQIDSVCKGFNENISIDLINWLLHPLLRNINDCQSLPGCIRKLTVPKLEKDLPMVTFKHPLNRLTELSVGSCLSTWTMENIILQARNFKPFQYMVSQLGSLKTFNLLGVTSNCNLIDLIPHTATTLDVPQNGLFSPANHSNPFGASCTNVHFNNITNLCIRLGNSVTKLPDHPSQIPFTNLLSLTVLHMRRKIDFTTQELNDFYAAILSKNPDIEQLCLDLVYIKPLNAVTQYCTKLKKLSLLNPTLDYSYPDSYDSLMILLAGIKSLEYLKLHVLGTSLSFHALRNFVVKCKSLMTFLIIQESTKLSSYTESVSTSGTLSTLLTMTNNSSESLANMFTDGNRSPDYLYDHSATNQELLSDLLLIEEGLQTLNNFDFDDLPINQQHQQQPAIADDFHFNFATPSRQSPTTLVEPYFFQPRLVEDLSENGFKAVQPDPKELNDNLKKSMLESFEIWQQEYFKVLDQFSEEPSMPEIKYLNNFQTAYTVIQCLIPESRNDFMTVE